MSDVESPATALTVFIAHEHTLARSLSAAVRRSSGSFLLVVHPDGISHLSDDQLELFFSESQALNRDRRLVIASKYDRALKIAAKHGWQTVSAIRQLKLMLSDHPSRAEALRAFSPQSWRRDIRSQLQFIGVLSLPKTRIWTLLILSIAVFLYVFFRLLPSAEVRIWPSQETQDFTTNVYLVESGANLPLPADRVKILPLYRLTVKLDRTLTYDQISKNFTGTNARITVTVYNDSDEPYSLRKGTRLINQAGMRFRLKEDAILSPRSKQNALAEADPLDQYGEVLGQRGNVPAGIKWDFPGLSEKERNFVYARNEKPGTGGATSYVNVLTKEDIQGAPGHPGARQRLEQELLMAAKEQVKEERTSRNTLQGTNLVQLNFQELTKATYRNFSMSEAFIGQNVSSIPVQGSIEYTVVLFDEDRLLALLRDQVLSHIPADKVVVDRSLSKDNMDIHVIAPWDDDLKWIKITADLAYNQRYVLSPLTPVGAKFGKYIRDSVAGKSVTEAYRVIKNLPEVSRVEISLWPPWAGTLPTIGSSIAIAERDE